MDDPKFILALERQILIASPGDLAVSNMVVLSAVVALGLRFIVFPTCARNGKLMATDSDHV